MNAVYFEVTSKKPNERINLRVEAHLDFRQAYARFEEARKRLAAAHEGNKDLEACTEKLYDAADEVILARQKAAAHNIEVYARAVNRREGVNLNHLNVEVINLGIVGRNFGNDADDNIAEAKKRFLEYKGNGAVIAYAMPWKADRVYVALGGAINAQKVIKLLLKRGYIVRSIDDIPNEIVGMKFGIPAARSYVPEIPKAAETKYEKPVSVRAEKTTPETVAIRKQFREGKISEREMKRRLNKVAKPVESVA
ncbi:hypothetical protein FJZ19_00535 [Candidatus Pacearchaeota archaeon]|nr:hypothetical protein [Candidatus Pacearchaeota archaeon]